MPRAEHWPPPQSSADQRELPNWTTGAKDGVGGSANARSRIWFTLVGGVITEVYYPTIDQANTRDLRLVLTGPGGFFADEGHDAVTELSPVDIGVPAYRTRSSIADGRCLIEQTVVTDDERAAVLARVCLQLSDTSDSAHDGKDAPQLYVLLAPHLGNQGAGNDGWLGRYKGVPMLFARRDVRAMALACSAPFVEGSCTHVGELDAWHDLHDNGKLTRLHPHALDGNLLLAAQIDYRAGEPFVLTLAFGDSPEMAGQQARAALDQDFSCVLDSYIRGWRAFHGECRPGKETEPAVVAGYKTSLAMLRVHEDKSSPGAAIASLAIPWGKARGDHNGGGYHLVWPRDLVEIAGGLLAAGVTERARLALLYLMSTQEESGHWPQNMWLDGKAYWHGVQLDEAGLPILLADALRRRDALDSLDVWPMVERAASYLVCNGPVTPEDRWEEAAGYSPFTLSVEVAALLVAADFAEARHARAMARYLRETADYWNASIERWTYVTGTDLARKLDLEGYYVRLAPPHREGQQAQATDESGGQRMVALKNHPIQSGAAPYGAIVSPDALALVRFGLRDANDPRLRNTVRAIDMVLCTQTTTGPVWHRFSGDTYGEHKDGAPFNGTGIGRGWPLLAGERAHYEVARGDLERARSLRATMLRQTSAGGLIPEQVWDSADIPSRGLYCGRPSGSAMPLVWAHAEYVKLCRSIEEAQVFDTPPTVLARYREHETATPFAVWRAGQGRRTMPPGKVLRVEIPGHKGQVRWRVVGATDAGEMQCADSGLGMVYADLPTAALPAGAEVRFAARAGKSETAGEEQVIRVESGAEGRDG